MTNFYATLAKGGKLKYDGLELLDDEVLLALKSHVRLEKGYSLRDLLKMFAAYPVFSRLDTRAYDCQAMLGSAPKIGCVHPDFAALCYQHSLNLDGTSEIIHFSVSFELLAQSVDGNRFVSIASSEIKDLLDLPLYFGLAEIQHMKDEDGDYSAMPAVSDMRVTLLDFVTDLLDCLFARVPELMHLNELERQIRVAVDEPSQVKKHLLKVFDVDGTPKADT